ncbi:hypothetical protein QFZ94_008398 [Paraburkholderia sp. JPY465]
MHYLDAAENDPRTVEVLESQHRPGPAFDSPMVLFDNVVQVLDLTDLDRRLARAIVESGVQRERREFEKAVAV